MSTNEALSEQEQKEAEALRQILDGSAAGLVPFDEGTAGSPKDREVVQLAMLGKLTHVSGQEWVPRNDASLRNEVLALAIRKAQSAAVTRPSLLSRRFISWLGLAVPGALALFIALRTETPSSKQEASLTVVADSQKEVALPSAAPARRSAEEDRSESASGGLPSQVALLRAQAAVLAERSRLNVNQKGAADALDRAWSDYRSHLIARLEQP